MREKPECPRHLGVSHEQIKHGPYLTILSHFPVPLGLPNVSTVLQKTQWDVWFFPFHWGTTVLARENVISGNSYLYSC